MMIFKVLILPLCCLIGASALNHGNNALRTNPIGLASSPTAAPFPHDPTYVISKIYSDSGCSSFTSMSSIAAGVCLWNGTSNFIFSCDGTTATNTVYSDSRCEKPTGMTETYSMNTCYRNINPGGIGFPITIGGYNSYMDVIACSTDPYSQYPADISMDVSSFHDSSTGNCTGSNIVNVVGYVNNLCLEIVNSELGNSLYYSWPNMEQYESSDCSGGFFAYNTYSTSDCYITDEYGLAVSFTMKELGSSPSVAPSVSAAPSVSKKPTVHPSVKPTNVPTIHPSLLPTKTPTLVPTEIPSISLNPTEAPSVSTQPVLTPSLLPTIQPSAKPTMTPSKLPTLVPSSGVTTLSPTKVPTESTYVIAQEYTGAHCTSFASMYSILTNTCLYDGENQEYLILTCGDNSVIATIYSNSGCSDYVSTSSYSFNTCTEDFTEFLACGTADPYYSYPDYTFPTVTFYHENTCTGSIFSVIGYPNDVCFTTGTQTSTYIGWPYETAYTESTTCSGTDSMTFTLSTECSTSTSCNYGLCGYTSWQEIPSQIVTPSVNPTGQPVAPSPTVMPTESTPTEWIQVTYYSDSECSVYAGEQGFALGTCYPTYTGEYASATYSLLNNGDPDTFQISLDIVYYWDSHCTESPVPVTTSYYGNCHYSNGYYYTTNLIDTVPSSFGADGALTVLYPTTDFCNSQSTSTWYVYTAYDTDICLPNVDGLSFQTSSCGDFQYCELGQLYTYGQYSMTSNQCSSTTSYSSVSQAVGYTKLSCYTDGGTTVVGTNTDSSNSGGGDSSSSSTTIAVAVVVPLVVVLLAAALAYYYFVVNGGAWSHETGPLAKKAEDSASGNVQVDATKA